MQSVSAVEHLWPTQSSESQQEHQHPSSDPFDQSHLSANDFSPAEFGGQSISGGGVAVGASEASGGGNNTISTANNNNSNVSNKQQHSPSSPHHRQTSPSFLNSSSIGTTGLPSSDHSSPIATTTSASTNRGSEYSPVLLSSYQKPIIGSSAAASNSSEDFFFQRDPYFLPRRNHTIGAGTTSNRRRLNSHFQFPSQGPTSPGQNSLSAITGGEDVDDDEWESMIKSRDDLVPGEDDREEPSQGDNRSSSAWQTDSSIFAPTHRRLLSQPSSAQAASPFLSGAHSPVDSKDTRGVLGHQRSESAHVRSLEQGPFASASTFATLNNGSSHGNFDAGMIRRHQSLNHATGRAVASRLQGSVRRNQYGDRQSTERRSPIAFFGQSSPHSTSPGAPMYSNASADVDSYSTAEANSAANTTGLMSSAVMEAHARLARMSIHPNNDTAHSYISEHPFDIDSNPVRSNDSDARKRLPSLITNREALESSANLQSLDSQLANGPVSAAACVPPIGHGHHRQISSSSPSTLRTNGNLSGNEISNRTSSTLQGSFSALPTSNTRSNQAPAAFNRLAASQHLEHAREGSQYFEHSWPNALKAPPLSMDNSSALNMAMLQQRLAQQHQQQPLSLAAASLRQQQVSHQSTNYPAMHYNQPGILPPLQQYNYSDSIAYRPQMNNLHQAYHSQPNHQPASLSTTSPALAALIAARGYNPLPTQFDLNPSQARFFVIKSFTEDDVQRSLKYEIWASTEKGNHRLDAAFKESQEKGGIPIYLFFSVNSSGHFCGMAQMISALDYNSTSNVWVQEGKWKGTFRVRWIYVKDVPNPKLRHIILTNTVERKPITQSRDTQELPTEGGRALLHIMAEYQHKTTLLQDWLFYEQQAMQQLQKSTAEGLAEQQLP